MPTFWPRCANWSGPERVSGRRAPLFVERDIYRRRRLLDAARILPAVGLIALLMPVLWVASGGTDTAAEALYLFGLWAGMIGAAAAMSHPLRRILERGSALEGGAGPSDPATEARPFPDSAAPHGGPD
jgi:hypothetical protein